MSGKIINPRRKVALCSNCETTGLQIATCESCATPPIADADLQCKTKMQCVQLKGFRKACRKCISALLTTSCNERKGRKAELTRLKTLLVPNLTPVAVMDYPLISGNTLGFGNFNRRRSRRQPKRKLKKNAFDHKTSYLTFMRKEMELFQGLLEKRRKCPQLKKKALAQMRELQVRSETIEMKLFRIWTTRKINFSKSREQKRPHVKALLSVARDSEGEGCKEAVKRSTEAVATSNKLEQSARFRKNADRLRAKLEAAGKSALPPRASASTSSATSPTKPSGSDCAGPSRSSGPKSSRVYQQTPPRAPLRLGPTRTSSASQSRVSASEARQQEHSSHSHSPSRSRTSARSRPRSHRSSGHRIESEEEEVRASQDRSRPRRGRYAGDQQTGGEPGSSSRHSGGRSRSRRHRTRPDERDMFSSDQSD